MLTQDGKILATHVLAHPHEDEQPFTPELLMEAAVWWIAANQLDQFEKATKIKKLVEKSI